jgi:hypothetical protein
MILCPVNLLIPLTTSVGSFKSTPNLVLGFEARRLPRSFLVLLESLLHKSPGGRPSVERVSAAIREGKVRFKFLDNGYRF